jgi:homocysteine S-methyltransferase
MSAYRNKLPQMDGSLFLTYTGMETDLVFTQCVDLPGFASYPLLETNDGRARLRQYFEEIIVIARGVGAGVILEGPTWVANRDRGAQIGYSAETLRERNVQSVALMADVRAAHGDLPVILSVNVGPRADAYAPATQMSADEATHYHTQQIEVVANTQADLISGYTVAYPEEAIGMVRAAQQSKLPVMISFTVETDGCLPTGMPLGDAIEAVDKATENYASYFMINCAHPDHFRHILSDAPWMTRLKGVVANASRCSHAVLDEATKLDDGDPEELGRQLGEIYQTYPNINILGGCCGTDMRHMACIAKVAKRC